MILYLMSGVRNSSDYKRQESAGRLYTSSLEFTSTGLPLMTLLFGVLVNLWKGIPGKITTASSLSLLLLESSLDQSFMDSRSREKTNAAECFYYIIPARKRKEDKRRLELYNKDRITFYLFSILPVSLLLREFLGETGR